MSETTGVAFQRIPANFIPPLFYVEFNNTLAGVVGEEDQLSLLIGQMTTGAPAAPLVPIYIPSVAFAMNQFGPNSMLARMCNTYFNSDATGPLWALPLADASGSTAAIGDIAFTGTATAAGSISLYIGNQLVSVNVSVGDTAAVIATNVAAAINALVLMPVGATAASGTVTLTARNAGVQGNNINLAMNYLGAIAGQQTPPGITYSVVAMTGGAGDPDMAAVAAALGDQEFDFIGHPYGETVEFNETTALMNDSTGRWAWNRQIYGHAFTVTPGTLSSLQTFGGTINDQHSTVFGSVGFQADPADIVSDGMGVIAVSLRNNPAQPVQSLQLNTVIGATRANWITKAQENALEYAGISVLRSDRYGNVSIGQCITTYKTNAYGQPDASYRYVTTLFTLMFITRQIKSALVTKFGRSILVPDGTLVGPGAPVVTPNIIKSEIIAQYAEMSFNDGVVVNVSAMAAATSVAINPTNPGRVDIVWRPELANGLSIMAMINQFILNPGAAA